MINEYSGWHWAYGWPRPASRAAERLAELQMPVLSFTGERDLADFHAVAATLERDAHARRVTLPRVGHMSPMEDPESFNRVVLDFLGEYSSSPATRNRIEGTAQ
jgi:pimeloyl-ACP methyl ester carboxylesterase